MGQVGARAESPMTLLREHTTVVSADAVAERVGQLSQAGADVVVLLSDGANPDPRPLLAALG